MRNSQEVPSSVYGIGCAVVVGVIILALVLVVPGVFDFYYVDSNEVGVVTTYGKFERVVGSGQEFVLFNPGYAITPVNVESRPFTFVIPQVALAGIEGEDNQTGNIQQQVTITVAGTIRNPINPTPELWQQYRSIYLADDPGDIRDQEMSKIVTQAVRVCTGDKTLTEVTVGQRNDIATCYNATVQPLAEKYGITVTVLSVTDVDPPQSVLDSIEAQSVLKQAAAQEEAQQEKDAAEAARLQAQQLNIAQSTAVYLQSQADQRIQQADNNRAVLEAEQGVAIVAATATAQALGYEQAQALVRLEIARVSAQAGNAQTAELARIYETYPQYKDLIVQEAIAAGFTELDKLIVLPPGTNLLQAAGYTLQGGQLVPIVSTPVPGS